MYLRNELKYKTDFTYNMFGPRDNSNDNTGENVRRWLKIHAFCWCNLDMMVLVIILMPAMWQMDPSGKLKDKMSWKGYHSGHMMYLKETRS
jgi:hypothetical protein